MREPLLLPEQGRTRAIDASRAAVVRWEKAYGLGDPPEHHCLLWAVFLASELAEAGLSAHLQAGTCMWPRLRPDQDDGLPGTFTHFSHVFEHGPARRKAMRGLTPEWHAWVAIPGATPDDAVIIDPTTGGWPGKCRLMAGLGWPGDPPPPYLWCRAADVPEGVVYRADPLAVRWAWAFARAVLTGQPLVLHLPPG